MRDNEQNETLKGCIQQSTNTEPEHLLVPDYFGDITKVRPRLGKYYNGNLAIRLIMLTGEPWATLTVNFEEKLQDGYAFADVNNCPWAPQIITKYKLGKPTGAYKQSGYCKYPLYKFDMVRLKELC